MVVGMGNLLCRDEGIGVHIIQEMMDMELPDHLQLLDIGTSTMDLIYSLEGIKKLIVVDAMKADGIPGAIYKCRPEDLTPRGEASISLHEIGLLETLFMTRKSGMEIETVIIGVEPKLIDWGLELSEEVRNSIPHVIEAVLRES